MQTGRAICVAVLTLSSAAAQSAGTISGRVFGVPGSIAIPHAAVELAGSVDPPFRTTADAGGSFKVVNLGASDYRLRVSSQGYQPIESTIHLDEDETKDLQITLVRDGMRRVDVISVRSTAESTGPGADGQFLLARKDIQNLATVIGDDPLRAVQAVPGVTTNNDFEARFSLRGADFSRIGVYLDGILLHDPIHGLEGTDLQGSAGIFNVSTIRQISLYDDAYPQQFGDSSAAVLDVSMRDGSRDRYHVRMNANIAAAGFEIEGPLNGNCSWIGAFRKTYIQYLLARALTDPSMAFGLEDGQGRATCQISRSNIVSLDLVDSNTDLNRTSIRNQLGANALMLVGQRTQVANLGWTFTPNDRLLVTNHLAWMTDWFDDQNPFESPLGRGSYTEWAGNSNVTWMWNRHDGLEAGFASRARRADGFTETYDQVEDLDLVDRYTGRDVLTGGYVSQSWTAWRGRVHLSASGRWDHDSLNGATAFSPQAGVTFGVTPALQLLLGWGQYAQMPDVTQLGSDLGGARLLPMRSTHVNAGLQYRLGSSTRLRLEVYDRQDRDLLYQPFYDPRLLNGVVFLPPAMPLYENSLRGQARGVEAYLQREMTRRLSGWVSYAYGRTWMHDGVSGDSFPSDWDQRHTANAYVSYAVRPTVNVSARFTYGSGFPVPGFLTMANGQFYLTDQRNTLRLAPYARLDFRVNKMWKREKWTTTLFAEVLNATNRTNVRFGSLDWYSTAKGPAAVSVDQMFPILPSVGVVWER
ncbi:MAG: TonB-dependent receptor [Silvibacterium sp.]|nr:TonB-dependent receptor [Silvibacterium sp.]